MKMFSKKKASVKYRYQKRSQKAAITKFRPVCNFIQKSSFLHGWRVNGNDRSERKMYERRAEETCGEQADGEVIAKQSKTYLALVIVYPPLAFGMLRNPPFRPHSRTDWPGKTRIAKANYGTVNYSHRTTVCCRLLLLLESIHKSQNRNTVSTHSFVKDNKSAR